MLWIGVDQVFFGAGYIRNWNNNKGYLWICTGVNADPDPAFPFSADPDPAFQVNADPDPAFHVNADPDPTFQAQNPDSVS